MTTWKMYTKIALEEMILCPVLWLILSFVLPRNLYTRTLSISVGHLHLWLTIPIILLAIMYSVIFYKYWFVKVNESNAWNLVLFTIVTMMSIGCSVAVIVSIAPDWLVQRMFSVYVKKSTILIEQATMFSVISLIEAISHYAYKIFFNNFEFSMRDFVIGFIGGFFGYVVIALTSVLSTATIWGCTVGILIRNNAWYSPPLIFIASLGIPPFWHTFYEYMAFSMIGVSASLISYSIVHEDKKLLRTSICMVIASVFLLIVAAFSEVTVDVSVIQLMKHLINFVTTIPQISITIYIILKLILTIMTSIGVLLIVIYTSCWIIDYTKERW